MNFYDVLGVDREADEPVVRRAFRRQARRYHPDVNDHPEASDQFAVLTRARDVLSDPAERDAYDRLGHADYVAKRIDGSFPSPEMDPQPRSGADGPAPGTSTRDPVAPDGEPVDEPPSAAAGSVETDPQGRKGRSNTMGESSGTGKKGGPNTSGESSGIGEEGSSDTMGDSSGTGEEGRSTTVGASAGTRAAGRSTTSDAAGEKAHSVPPTPGATQAGTAETDGSPWAKPSGPERLGRDARRRARDEFGKFTDSPRWLGVLVAAGIYAIGVAGYFRTHRAGLGELAASMTSLDAGAVAGALLGERYGVPDPATYAWSAGLRDGLAPTDGTLLVAGAVLLPLTLGAAVAGLRLRTAWRPSWLHALGSLAPAVAVGLGYAVAVYPGVVRLSSVPLPVDLLLLVVLPALALASFFLNRVLLVVRLWRRDDAAPS